MNIADICNLPLEAVCDDNAVLFLWTTYPMLKEALMVIEAWGFRYKSIGFQWVKLNKRNGKPFYGLGRWTRGNTEPCLIAVKGKPSRKSKAVFQLIQEPMQGHSKKPDIVKNKIVELMGDLPRIELFARQKTEGWDVWGNEVESDIDLTHLGKKE
jgi:N6-adenosine-specific RNA methylase IME4